MDKEKARELLENFLSAQASVGEKINLPVYDCVVHTESKSFIDGQREIIEYTFKYLIQIAYDL